MTEEKEKKTKTQICLYFLNPFCWFICTWGIWSSASDKSPWIALLNAGALVFNVAICVESRMLRKVWAARRENLDTVWQIAKSASDLEQRYAELYGDFVKWKQYVETNKIAPTE